jgi:hypothetical protein
MHVNIIFILFTFIVIVMLALLSDTLTTAVLVVSLTANFLAICAHFRGISDEISKVFTRLTDREPAQPKQLESISYDDIAPTIYGENYDQWNSYRAGLQDSDAELHEGDIDTKNTYMARRREKNKKCSDGWAIKESNYFKHHYANELDEAEKKPWWGAAEY